MAKWRVALFKGEAASLFLLILAGGMQGQCSQIFGFILSRPEPGFSCAIRQFLNAQTLTQNI